MPSVRLLAQLCCRYSDRPKNSCPHSLHVQRGVVDRSRLANFR